jgi:hypothetical protein
MRTAGVITFLLLAAGPVLGDEPSAVPELTSLHGTMITMISETEGVPAEIWAKGDMLRSETAAGEAKVITIQLGDTMYTFAPGSKKGHKTKFAAGLASLGLIQQISLVKAKGKREGTQEIEGVAYDKYFYDANAPQEWAVAFLDAKTSLPKYWISAVRTGEKKALAVRMHYRDMEANVEISDDKFELPRDVEFTEISAAELMATAELVGGKQPPAAPAESPNPSDDATH